MRVAAFRPSSDFSSYTSPAATETYSLSLHDALPIWLLALVILVHQYEKGGESERDAIYRMYLASTKHINNWDLVDVSAPRDRKSTRLNSSHMSISYAVFCLKKKNVAWQSQLSELCLL